MTNWLKKHDRAVNIFFRETAVTVSIIALVVIAFAFGFFLRGVIASHDAELMDSLTFTPEPEVCALCGNGISYHAPVLVNLSTGEKGEIQVYDPDPRHRGEIAEEQSTGTFSFISVAGLIGYRDTCEPGSEVTLPEDKEPITPSHFCRNCRAILAKVATEGYILADLHNLKEIVAYGIQEGDTYTIRDYAVSISKQNESDELSIHVTGLLSMNEG